MIEQLVTVVHTMTRNTEEQLLDIQLKDVAYVMSREQGTLIMQLTSDGLRGMGHNCKQV